MWTRRWPATSRPARPPRSAAPPEGAPLRRWADRPLARSRRGLPGHREAPDRAHAGPAHPQALRARPGGARRDGRGRRARSRGALGPGRPQAGTATGRVGNLPARIDLLGPPVGHARRRARGLRHAQGDRAARAPRAGRAAALARGAVRRCCGRSRTPTTRAARCGGRCPCCGAGVGAELVDRRATASRSRAVDVDVRRFRAHAAAGEPRRRSPSSAGRLLEGFALRDSPDFDTWQPAQEAALARASSARVLARRVEELTAAGDYPARARARRSAGWRSTTCTSPRTAR